MLAGTPRAKKLGDDDGCFAAALASVRRWGGVLEHPEGSHAFRHFGLDLPPRSGGWLFRVGPERRREAVCCVEQGHYGHRARKATWLYTCGVDYGVLPDLIWGPSKGERLEDGFHTNAERQAARAVSST